jgi:cytochrome c-type biogenesis protein CcmH
MRLRLLLPIAALLAGLAAVGSAQGPSEHALDAQTRELAAKLRCPVCQGVSIQDSPTELAQEMRSVIRQQLAAGRSSQEVKSYFVERYGEWVLLEPEPRGFNLVVYLLPLVGLLTGGGLVVALVRRWTRPPPPSRTLAGVEREPPARERR